MELNKIYNEDCLEGMKRMEENSVSMVITSPPYNFNLRIHYGEYGGRSIHDQNKYNSMYADALSMDEYFEWQRDCILEMMRICNGLVFYNIQMITGNKVALFRLFGEFANKIKEVIIWDKINAEPAIRDGVLNSNYEFIIVFDKKEAIQRQFTAYNFARGTETNIFRIGKNTENTMTNHSACFPVDLPRKIIKMFAKEGDTIFDPFMGSGTTAVAAIREKCNFIGFELNKEYYEKACKRIAAEQAQLTLF